MCLTVNLKRTKTRSFAIYRLTNGEKMKSDPKHHKQRNDIEQTTNNESIL